MPNNSYGLTYPDANSAADGPDAVKDLADSVGPYSNMRFANAAARDALLAAPVEGMHAWLNDLHLESRYDGAAWRNSPYAFAAVSTTLSGTGASLTGTWTWPASRFTVAPLAWIVNAGGTGSSAFSIQISSPPTTSGGSFLAVSHDGASHVLTLMLVYIFGVQMLSNAGAG